MRFEQGVTKELGPSEDLWDVYGELERLGILPPINERPMHIPLETAEMVDIALVNADYNHGREKSIDIPPKEVLERSGNPI